MKEARSMLTSAANFWPLLWTIVGGGAVLTVLLSLLVARFSPTWFRTPRRRQPAVAASEPQAQVPERLANAA
jgi:peptidoglycan/LPS O-acetylase OafA/YrhL